MILRFQYISLSSAGSKHLMCTRAPASALSSPLLTQLSNTTMNNPQNNATSPPFPTHLPPRPLTLTQRITRLMRPVQPAPQSFEMRSMGADAGGNGVGEGGSAATGSGGGNGGSNTAVGGNATGRSGAGGDALPGVVSTTSLDVRGIRERYKFTFYVIACTTLAVVFGIVVYVLVAGTPAAKERPFQLAMGCMLEKEECWNIRRKGRA